MSSKVSINLVGQIVPLSLNTYSKAKDQLGKIAKAEIRLNKFCQRVRQNLANSTFSEKRLALEALDIKVVATKDDIKITGVIPIEVSTSESPQKADEVIAAERSWRLMF